uniref:Sad1 and UNC84 domain containing 2 n=1 Tax=Peromyscus maniculatus bairdii TaxID=230844 RepID=A0A8C8T452_PERMB
MSRRSQRLTRYSQDDNDGSSSSGASSVAGSQSTLFKDSPLRTLKRKSSNMKRLSPAPQLGPSSDSHTSYYSESVVRESFIGSPRAASLARSALLEDRLHSEPYWSGELRGRRRRGTGGSEGSKANGLAAESKASEDFFGSSSGYSSEDDFAGRLFGLLYWWVGTTWYRLTTAASLLDVFVLTRSRHFPLNLKTFLWFLLFLLLLTGLTYGAWYFYPFGLHTLQPTLASWWAAKESRRQPEVWESRDASPHFPAEQRILSRVHSLERRLEALAAEFSSNWQKEAIRLERLELRQGAAGHGGGSGLSHEDTLSLLEGLVSRREAALKEDLRRDTAARLQEELAALRAEHHQDSEDLFKKIVQASQESEARVQQLKTEWQRMTQEAFQESSMKELGRLEAQLASLRQELAALTLRQNSVADEVGLLPQKIQAARADVESQFPDWVSQFLLRDKGARSGLLRRDEMHAQLQELESKILASVAEMQGKSVREAAASLGRTLQKEGVVGVTEEQVHRIVKQALQRYSEDRIGMVDYALESGGASVISTRCSETYETKTALLSLFGIPLWYHSQSPRVILQPDVHPGNCWAFQGPQGFAVVRLSARIRPTAVTLEHVPKALSPNSTISSAPKDFAIFGFDEDLQQEGTLLGTFAYDQDGEPIQTFYFQASKMATYQVVELRILTNWGHPEYTCIYRFRVHGEPAH